MRMILGRSGNRILRGEVLARLHPFRKTASGLFYLPDDRVIYAREVGGRFVIEAKELASNKTLALTYLPSSAIPTDVLRDGRILFESNYPLGVGGNPEIYTVYSDGSGVESYRCDHGAGHHSARQQASGETVFSSSHGLAKFTSARAEESKLSLPAGEYAGDVAEMTEGDWLLAWRPESKSTYRLMRWVPGGRELKPLLAESGVNVIQPVLLAPRTVPNRHPSGLHDWPNANLLCLNAYTAKRQLVAGSIRSVRLYARDESGHPRLLGTAPVERDGSFFVQVPSEQPIQFELSMPPEKACSARVDISGCAVANSACASDATRARKPHRKMPFRRFF